MFFYIKTLVLICNVGVVEGVVSLLWYGISVDFCLV